MIKVNQLVWEWDELRTCFTARTSFGDYEVYVSFDHATAAFLPTHQTYCYIGRKYEGADAAKAAAQADFERRVRECLEPDQ